MKNISTILSLCFMLVFSVVMKSSSAIEPLTYCTPVFTNGCDDGSTSWYNHAIDFQQLNWQAGGTGTSTCTDYDFTSWSATVYAGVPYPMTVINGQWCGVSVWFDYNQNEDFDSTENLYHEYTGGAPTHTYNFNITVPANIPTGSYRMRVIASWGADGYLNGEGGCGNFQYGNFDDFTINVVNPAAGIENPNAVDKLVLLISPNPATDIVSVTMSSYKGNDARLRITDITGKIIETYSVSNTKMDLDISKLANGIYILCYTDGIYNENIRFVK
jgi:hypothetical protein